MLDDGSEVIVEGEIISPANYIIIGAEIFYKEIVPAIIEKEGKSYYDYTVGSNHVYVSVNATLYPLTVINGKGNGSTLGSYASGSKVNIVANPGALGKEFDKWISSSGGVIENINSSSTYYTMPASAATVEAIYKDVKPVTIFDQYTEAKVDIADVSGAIGFNVYRSTKKNSGYKEVGTCNSNLFEDSLLVAGKTYYYKAKAVTMVKGKAVTGKFSSVITANTPKLPTVDDVDVRKGEKSLTFEWNNKNGMVAVQIYIATSNNKKTKWTKYLLSSNIFTLKKLVGNKKYYYKLRYVYYYGTTSYSDFTKVENLTTD